MKVQAVRAPAQVQLDLFSPAYKPEQTQTPQPEPERDTVQITKRNYYPTMDLTDFVNQAIITSTIGAVKGLHELSILTKVSNVSGRAVQYKFHAEFPTKVTQTNADIASYCSFSRVLTTEASREFPVEEFREIETSKLVNALGTQERAMYEQSIAHYSEADRAKLLERYVAPKIEIDGETVKITQPKR